MNTPSIRAIKLPDEPYQPSLWEKFKGWPEPRFHSPFSNWLHVESLEAYRKLPYFEKTVWGLFYRYHFVESPKLDFLDSMRSKSCKNEDKLIDAYKKKRWPVQFFIRETLRFRLFKFSDFWYHQVSSRIRPRQKWLTKIIPRTWADKTWLIPEINYAMVVNFIEEEKCFANTDYDGSSEGHGKFANELRECYNYIKVERPALLELIQGSYPDADTMTGDYYTDYAENNRLEKQLVDSDTKYLTWIVVNREYFWT